MPRIIINDLEIVFEHLNKRFLLNKLLFSFSFKVKLNYLFISSFSHLRHYHCFHEIYMLIMNRLRTSRITRTPLTIYLTFQQPRASFCSKWERAN